MESPEQIIRQVCSGDVDAFDTLFRQYQKSVYRTAYLLTGNKEAAEDVLQEVFISVWKYCKTYDPKKGRFLTWLHRIIVNRCHNTMKKTNKNAFLLIDEMQSNGVQIVAGKHETPEEKNITREEYERLMGTMKDLSEELRTVVVLRFFNGLPYKEIAAATAIPLGTVKSRLNAALKQMSRRFYDGGSVGRGM